MAAEKKQSARSRKQDRPRVAGGQHHEVGYTAKKTNRLARGGQRGRQENGQQSEEGGAAAGSMIPKIARAVP